MSAETAGDIRVEPTDAELVWLKAAISRWHTGQPLDAWGLRIELRDQLPPDFVPSDLRSPFIKDGRPTLLGVFTSDPADTLITEVESAIFAVRDQIIAHPQSREISAADVGDRLGRDAVHVDELFRLMGTAGRFFNGSSGQGEQRYLLLRFDEQCLAEYLAFGDIRTKLAELAESSQSAQDRELPRRGAEARTAAETEPPTPSSDSLESLSRRMWTCHEQPAQHEFRQRLRYSTQTANEILQLRDARPVGLSGPTKDVADEHAGFLERLAAQRSAGEPATGELEQKFEILLAARQLERDYSALMDAGVRIGALIYFDIDSFKALNDTFTEEVIDRRFLPGFQEQVALLIRGRGTAYRRGGDEFVVLLPNHTEDEASAFTERLRANIEEFTAKIDERSVSVTVSLGLSCWDDVGTGFDSLCDSANTAKRHAKKIGKNRVVPASDLDK